MKSVLEHMPHDPKFFDIMKETYRILKNDHDICRTSTRIPPCKSWTSHIKNQSISKAFRCLTNNIAKNLLEEKAQKLPAVMYNVNFKITNYSCNIDPMCEKHIRNVLGTFDNNKIESYSYLFNNVAATQKIELKVVK